MLVITVHHKKVIHHTLSQVKMGLPFFFILYDINVIIVEGGITIPVRG